MRQLVARFVLVALVPTAVDIGLLVWLRVGLGWVLVVADLTAIATATVVSYAMHRSITFGRDSFVRWVQMPWAFAAVAGLAAMIDVAVLQSAFVLTGFDTVAGLVAAKVISLGCAALVRFGGYRTVLTGEVRSYVSEPGPPLVIDGGTDVSIVVPAFSEEAGIATTVAELRQAAIADGRQVEIVIVDDGSRDATADRALEAGADQVVVLAENCGKGAAVRAGMLAARGRVVVFTDADLAYAPEVVLGTADLVDAGWDVVVGDRRHPDAAGRSGANTLRSLGSRAINLATYAVLLGSYRDTQCGLKAFRGDVARSIFARTRLDGFAFDVEVFHLIERDRLSLRSIPVQARHSERSTVSVGRDAVRMLRDLWRVRRWSSTGVYEQSELATRRWVGSGPHG
ncbi:MAG TPA: glycosyltransferase [Acidimicrobiales bacterium]|nr:glycosyltransferase [Acidimicrobiales bacterium]